MEEIYQFGHMEAVHKEAVSTLRGLCQHVKHLELERKLCSQKIIEYLGGIGQRGKVRMEGETTTRGVGHITGIRLCTHLEDLPKFVITVILEEYLPKMCIMN